MKTKILCLYSILILYVFFFLMLGINVYALNPMIQENISEDEILIDKKIQVKADFSWSFLPFFHRAEQGDLGLGYFLPTGVYQAPKGSNFLQVDKIAFSKYTISGETLLEDIETRFQKFCTDKEDTSALILIDGNAQIDEVIRLDLGEYDHWLYLRKDDEVYQLYGNVKTIVWQRFLDAFSVNGDVEFAGCEVWNRIFQLDSDYEDDGSRRRVFCYKKAEYTFFEDSVLISQKHDAEGFELTVLDKDYPNGEDETTSTISLKKTEPLPEFETEEEMLAYFQEKYPQMDSYAVHPIEFKDIYGDRRRYLFNNTYRYIKSGDTHYIYYTQNGVPYEIVYQGVGRELWSLRSNAGYDYNEIFTWMKYEDGTIIQGNLVTEEYYLEKNVNGDVPFSFHIKRNKDIEKDTEIGEATYIIEIYKKGEPEPFQIINEASAQWNPFSFEDFNADGYSDLFIDYYYGANGGTAFHYVWSPSREKFVKMPEDLEYYGFYYMDPLTRRMYMHHHGSAVSGTETTYQWKNETDYEVIKHFSHDTVWPRVDDEDYIEVIIREFKDNKEKILTEYIYTMDEYDADMSLLWDSYYADFTWEKEVKSPDSKEKYVLRYAQDSLRDDNGEILPDACVDELYVYNSDTRILNRIINESKAPYSQILWQDENQDGEEELIIKYEDGTQVHYTWEQLLNKKENKS